MHIATEELLRNLRKAISQVMEINASFSIVTPAQAVLRAAFVYPITFLATIGLYAIAHRYKDHASHNKPLQYMNTMFVEWGMAWFTMVYFAQTSNFAKDRYFVKDLRFIRLLFRYVLYLLVWFVFHGGIFGVLIVEVVNSATGGFCVGADMTMNSCTRNPETHWVDGFDISSHYFVLLSWSLLLLHAILVTVEGDDIALHSSSMAPIYRTKYANRCAQLVAYVLAALLTVWYLEFCITSIFFHTILERFLGLIGIPAALAIIRVDERVFADSDLENDLAEAADEDMV